MTSPSVSWRPLWNCRVCASTALQPAFVLPETPLANAYRSKPRSDGAPPTVPLTVMVCPCGHSQLREHVPGDALFSNYLYTTGASKSFQQHFAAYAEQLKDIFAERAKTMRLLEVGANDGTFLREAAKRFGAVMGVEPARNLVELYTQPEAPLLCDSFGMDFARRWVLGGGEPFDVVVANNVFAHVESLTETMQALALVTRPGASLFVEVQYAEALWRTGAFDMVYHEHRDYHRASSWDALLDRFDWRLVDVEDVPTHGGSIRLRAVRMPSPMRGSERLAERFEDENNTNPLAEWSALQTHVEAVRLQLREALMPFKRVAVYGAPAKLTTLSAAFGLGLMGNITYVVDDAPTKQGLYTPDGRWPIYPRTMLRDVQHAPDAILVGAWNVKADIVNAVRTANVAVPLIVPFPAVEVIR